MEACENRRRLPRDRSTGRGAISSLAVSPALPVAFCKLLLRNLEIILSVINQYNTLCGEVIIPHNIAYDILTSYDIVCNITFTT